MKVHGLGCWSVTASIKPVSHDWVAQSEHVNTQLVRSAGNGMKVDQCGLFSPLYDGVVSQSRAPILEIYGVAWSVRAGDRGYGQFYGALVILRMPPNLSDIELFDVSFPKLLAQIFFGLSSGCHHHDARSIHVEAVYRQCQRVLVLYPGKDAVVHAGRAPWNREEPTWFVDDDHIAVAVQNDQPRVFWRIVHKWGDVGLVRHLM